MKVNCRFTTTSGTYIHQAFTIREQLTGKTGNAQIDTPTNKPSALPINLCGGDDVSVVAIVYRKM